MARTKKATLAMTQFEGYYCIGLENVLGTTDSLGALLSLDVGEITAEVAKDTLAVLGEVATEPNPHMKSVFARCDMCYEGNM